MKILLVSPYFIDSYKGNISMGSAVKLALNLSKRNEVLVLTTGRDKKKEKLNKNLTVVSVAGVLIPDPVNYMISFSLLVRFWRTILEFNPKVVVVSKYMFFSSLVIPLARLRKVPVVTVTDTFPGINWFSTSKLASCVMWVYARLIGLPLLRMSNKVVVLYEGLSEIAKRYRLNYVVIGNGVESKFFKKLAKPVDIKKTKGEFWVGFVGRSESAKGFKQVLKMAKDLETEKKIRFVFVGGGSEPRTEDNKIFLGFRQDVMNIYQMFDVLVLPSHAEGLPNVVMEAMSQGVPVVANKVGGVVSIITDGINGVLVESDNSRAMQLRVLNLYKKPTLRRQLGRVARKRIVSDFSWDKIIGDYERLLRKLCVV